MENLVLYLILLDADLLFHCESCARHGKAVYWDLGSAQSLGTVTADLKPGVARVEVGTFVRWDNKLGRVLEQISVCCC